MLMLATQKPDSKVMPDSLRGQLGIRFAMKVMNWQSSDTILGAGAYPTWTHPNYCAHKGVGILLGADDSALAESGGQIIRTDLMDLSTLHTICERGRELRIKAGTLSGVADGGAYIVEHAAPRLLDDVLAVFTGDEARLWSETVITRLAEANPDAYDGWTPLTWPPASSATASPPAKSGGRHPRAKAPTGAASPETSSRPSPKPLTDHPNPANGPLDLAPTPLGLAAPLGHRPAY
jgi:DNA segregation ATPase FtsK/SpoIIIE, S-DNA-T family